MRFFEYEARELVKRAGVPVTDYGFTTEAGEAGEGVFTDDHGAFVRRKVVAVVFEHGYIEDGGQKQERDGEPGAVGHGWVSG